MSPTNLVRYTAWIDKQLVEKLRTISKRTRIPASVLLREAIEVVIRKYRKNKV
ncbi:MAG: ribbon-helix-helix domain-containing protein [Acidobacteria bacterium]|nr:MAG: ribbon-helix-helix domain-containing protein [Acidobacteriota bacterium]